MIESRYRPTDRPHKLWCKVCRRYLLDKWNCSPKPKDVGFAECTKCEVLGSMVFRYRDDLYFPKCGNLFCVGDCEVLECAPPKNDLVKSNIFSLQHRKTLSIVAFIAWFFLSLAFFKAFC